MCIRAIYILFWSKISSHYDNLICRSWVQVFTEVATILVKRYGVNIFSLNTEYGMEEAEN